MLYMCPNGFELYDKTNKFEHYDTVLSAIKGRDAAGALEAMVEFSIRMVVQRWEKILEYFTWLLGHRDTLSDPDAHDSLLFDDDSFSRSRRYFWAINYLAELDISISGNIIQLERFIGENLPYKLLREQLNQLQYLRERILGQRDEAIALRDGVSDFKCFIARHGLATYCPAFFQPLQPVGFMLIFQIAIQCERGNGKQSIDKAQRKHQSPYIRQHILPPTLILHGISHLPKCQYPFDHDCSPSGVSTTPSLVSKLSS